jgi:MFS superfamily sulfate permease-like transporter
VDEREFRAAQAAVGVLLLGAFVFRMPEIVYVITLVVAVGALLGARFNLFHAAYRAAIGPRLKPAVETVSSADVRALDTLATVVLGLASLALLAGIDLIGWFLALVQAGVAAVAATTGINAARALLEQFQGRD